MVERYPMSQAGVCSKDLDQGHVPDYGMLLQILASLFLLLNCGMLISLLT